MSKIIFLSAASMLCLLHPCPINGQGFTMCIYYRNCSATTNLGVIDLNLASKTDPYSTIDSVTGYSYSWKPCLDFTLHGVTAGAIQEPLGGYIQDLGVHSSASCTVNSNGYVMFYMLSATYIRTTYVTCLCGSNNTLQFVNEYPASTYNFVFTSDACCANSGSGTTTSTITPSPERRTGIPASNQLVIMDIHLHSVCRFFSLLVVVLVCGTLFLVTVNQSMKRKTTTYNAL